MNNTVDKMHNPDSVNNQDWQSSKLTTLDRTKHILETSLYADCDFLVGDEKEVLFSYSKFYLSFL